MDTSRAVFFFTDLADLLSKPVDAPRTMESRFRSGYRDGWIACLEALSGSLPRQHYDAAWDFWAQALLEWKHEKAGEFCEPPSFDVPPRKPSISAKLRYAILKRDAFRCQLCGTSARDGHTT